MTNQQDLDLIARKLLNDKVSPGWGLYANPLGYSGILSRPIFYPLTYSLIIPLNHPILVASKILMKNNLFLFERRRQCKER